MSPRYLRKVNGSLVCREDGQPVTSHAAHVAQWHSLSPRPNPQGEAADMQPATITYSDWRPPQDHGHARGPWEAM